MRRLLSSGEPEDTIAMLQEWRLVDIAPPETQRVITIAGWCVDAPSGSGLAEYVPGMIVDLPVREARDACAIGRAVPYSPAAARSRGITATEPSGPIPCPPQIAQPWKAGRTMWVPAPGQNA